MEPIIAVTLFVLAVFLGVELITKVPPTLHTPLMSGSNAISGITVVGALVAAGTEYSTLTTILGFVAVVLAVVKATPAKASSRAARSSRVSRAGLPARTTREKGPAPRR